MNLPTTPSLSLSFPTAQFTQLLLPTTTTTDNTSTMAPDEHLQPAPALFPTYNRFAIHGAITMLVVIFVFLLFLSFLLLRLYLRQSEKPIGNSSDHFSSSVATSSLATLNGPEPSFPPPTVATHQFAMPISLPVYRYPPDHIQNMECAVCLSEFREKEIVRRIPNCGHDFHKKCIDLWFRSHTSCPLCREHINSLVSEVGLASEVDQQLRLELLLRSIESTLRNYENKGFGGQSSQQMRDYQFQEMRRSLENMVIL